MCGPPSAGGGAKSGPEWVGPAASVSGVRASAEPGLVIEPRLVCSALEYSEGTSPAKDTNALADGEPSARPGGQARPVKTGMPR